MGRRTHKEKTGDTRTPSRLDPETRRAQIVTAAAGVFEGRDPASVGFEEVAEAAGVSRSLVYAYFHDRGGLIAAVYLHNLDRLDRDLGKALDAGLPNEVQLRRLIRRYLVFARDNQDAWNLMTAAGALQHPAVQGARRARIERIAAAWEGEPASRMIAQAVVGMLEAAAQDWLHYRDCGLERATDVLLAMIWQGLHGLADRGVLAAS